MCFGSLLETNKIVIKKELDLTEGTEKVLS